MGDGVTDRTAIEDSQRLWQAAGHDFARLFRSAVGYETIDVPGGTLAVTGVAAPDLNCGVVFGAADPAGAMHALAEELRRRTLPGLLLVPDVISEAAGRGAAACGMVVAARMPLMTRGAGCRAADSRFVVRRATSTADLDAANRLIAAAFELPPATIAAAFGPKLLAADDVSVELICDGDVPVGCLQVTAAGPLVGIWSMATPPEQRRRGIARAGLEHVLAHRLSSAESRAFLIATEAGRPLYDAVGFETVAWCSAWLLEP